MTLDVPSEYEYIIRQAVASGAFADEQSALRHALQLLADQQDLVRSFADSGKAEADETATAYDAFTRLGVIGCMEKGPSDLATNPEHMDGFGR